MLCTLTLFFTYFTISRSQLEHILHRWNCGIMRGCDKRNRITLLIHHAQIERKHLFIFHCLYGKSYAFIAWRIDSCFVLVSARVGPNIAYNCWLSEYLQRKNANQKGKGIKQIVHFLNWKKTRNSLRSWNTKIDFTKTIWLQRRALNVCRQKSLKTRNQRIWRWNKYKSVGKLFSVSV